MNSYDIIIKPILSEKSYGGVSVKKYTFKVHPDADKTAIKNAVEEIFGVKVDKVNTMNVQGKIKRMGKYQGRRPGYKKAVVQLKADSKPIEFFESLS
ncbi:MAG: 50S ribosomal protein L23 [Christensenellales bacterium]|jgi:large subunit ribosomal protein L23